MLTVSLTFQISIIYSREQKSEMKTEHDKALKEKTPLKKGGGVKYHWGRKI